MIDIVVRNPIVLLDFSLIWTTTREEPNPTIQWYNTKTRLLVVVVEKVRSRTNRPTQTLR